MGQAPDALGKRSSTVFAINEQQNQWGSRDYNTALEKRWCSTFRGINTAQCFDIFQDWNRFLEHLSSFDLCVLPDTTSNSTRLVDEEQSDSVGNVSITVTASLSLVQQLSSLPHNITTVAGFLPIGGMIKTSSSSHVVHNVMEFHLPTLTGCFR